VSIAYSWKGGSAPREGPSSEESSVSDSSMASSYKNSARDPVSDISMGSPYRDGSTSIDCSASNTSMACACEDGSDVITEKCHATRKKKRPEGKERKNRNSEWEGFLMRQGEVV
jgi:hypothetical protein